MATKNMKSVNVWTLKQVRSKSAKFEKFDAISNPRDVVALMDKTEMYQVTSLRHLAIIHKHVFPLIANKNRRLT